MNHAHVQSYSAFGVPFAVRVEVPGLEELLGPALPPVLEPTEHVPDDGTFVVSSDGSSYISLVRGEHWLGDSEDPDVAIDLLSSAIRARIALNARDHVFVHAGAVVVAGRAVLIPGASFAGKSTLVAALLARGAAYLSDEFAPLDAEGRVHPYARPLQLRPGGPSFAVAAAPAVADTPKDVGAIVITTYRPGTSFQVERATPARGALALLENAAVARERPAQVMSTVRTAASQAVVYDGERGEADQAADAIIRLMA